MHGLPSDMHSLRTALLIALQEWIESDRLDVHFREET